MYGNLHGDSVTLTLEYPVTSLALCLVKYLADLTCLPAESQAARLSLLSLLLSQSIIIIIIIIIVPTTYFPSFHLIETLDFFQVQFLTSHFSLLTSHFSLLTSHFSPSDLTQPLLLPPFLLKKIASLLVTEGISWTWWTYVYSVQRQRLPNPKTHSHSSLCS